MPQEEIVQVALMRNCWVRAEEIFRIQLRTLCSEMKGDKHPADQLRKQLLQGSGPAEVAFVAGPLVEMITTIRNARQRLDKALEMAVAADPLESGKGILLEVPRGYISRQEALAILGVPDINFLVGHARVVATARKVEVARGGYRGGRSWFYPRQDIERAKELDQDEISARVSRKLAHVARDRTRGVRNGPGIMSLKAAAKRLGADRDAIIRRGWLPSLRRIGCLWSVAISDVVAFEQQEADIKARIAAGELVSADDAGKKAGLTRGAFWLRANDIGIQPTWLRNRKAFYALTDVERVIQEVRDQRALRDAFKSRPLYPAGAIPLLEALATVGLSPRQWRRVQEGKSGTPMPPTHKAESGRLYCLPDELAAFTGINGV